MNIAGNRYGKLIVVSENGRSSKGEVLWNCICDCGNTHIASGSNLRNKKVTSCGCNKHISRKKVDLTGKRFDRLLVMSNSTSNNKHTMWECLCDCGIKKIVAGRHLLSGATVSCGCYNRSIVSIDISGRKFGKLLVIKKSGDIAKHNGCYLWECICECGNITYVSTADLTKGHTTSCGCLVSKGEFKILQLLRDNCIKYKQQYGFNGLRSDKNYMYRFDFGIMDKSNNLVGLVEFDGQQHFIDCTWSKASEIQKRDAIKNEYCCARGIPLNRIKYNEEITIERILLGIPYDYKLT